MDNTIHWINFYRLDNLSPSQRLPLGISIKIAIIEKKWKARGGRWEEGKGEKPLFSLPPFHRAPRALFLSPQPPHKTKKLLRRGEVDSTTGLPNCSSLVLRTGVMT